MNKGAVVNRWAEALIISLVFLVPIAICRRAYDWVLVKLLITQILTAGIFLCLIFKEEKWTHLSSLDTTVFVYGAICLFSLLISDYKYASFSEFGRLFPALLLYVGIRHFATRISLRRFVTTWIISAIIVCVYGIAGFTKNGLMLSTFGNQNFTAGYLTLVLPLTFCLSYYAFSRGTISNKIFYPASFVLILITLVLTRSRAVLLGLGVGGAILLVFSCADKRRKILLVLLIILIIASLIYFIFGEGLLTMVFNDIRPWLWKSSWTMLKERPVFGYGLGTYPIYNLKFRSKEYLSHVQAADITEHAHCEFLEVACETGIVGALVFLAILLTFFISSFRKINHLEGYTKALCLGLISGVSALLAHNLTDVNMRFTSSGVFFWFSLGLISGLGEEKEISEVPSLKPVVYKSCITAGLILLVLITIKTVTVDFLSNLYLKAGIDKRNKGDWTMTVGYYKKALEANSYLIPAYRRLSYACGMLGDYGCAAWANQEILKISPYYGPAYKDLGIIYFRQNRLDEALSNFQKASNLLPYDAEILSSLRSIKEMLTHVPEE